MFKKGAKKIGGRKKGTLNKKSLKVFQLCEKSGLNPVEVLISLAGGRWKKLGYSQRCYTEYGNNFSNERLYITVDHRLGAAKELMKYMYPQLKAMEHKLDDNSVETFSDFMERILKD